ncbi:universal stress protein [Nocardioides sp.]|uniref:universal stress protein n=1 Tax=Nocardioides sp. TaxID=35761 RepID=UPI0035648076
MSGLIVVGVDTSAAAAAALAWAAVEARLRDAELVLCAVADKSAARGGDGAAQMPLSVEAIDECTQGYPVTVITPEGDPGEQLLAACDGADLLVMGSRGRGTLAGAVLGSVSRVCVAHASCPVVIVRHQAQEPRSGGRVLVAVDGSEHARRALVVAAEEARLRKVDLEVLHAVRWDSIGTELMVPSKDQLLEWGHTFVEKELRETGVEGQPVVLHGRAEDVLVQHCRPHDLLVLGSGAHHAVSSLLLGSVGEHVVRQAPCPVMVTRAQSRHPQRDGN